MRKLTGGTKHSDLLPKWANSVTLKHLDIASAKYTKCKQTSDLFDLIEWIAFV